MSDNKLVKTVLNAATLVGLSASIGYVAKKIMKKNFIADPSASIENYGMFTLVMSASVALKKYLEIKKSFQIKNLSLQTNGSSARAFVLNRFEPQNRRFNKHVDKK